MKNKIDQKLERESMKEQGYFDGRFRNKVVMDKKKFNKKKERQTKVSW